MSEPAYTSTFAAVQANSFPSAPLPQSSPSFSSLPIPESSDTSSPQSIDYTPILSSSPTLSSSTSTTPLLQQTSFTFPTPPPSNSSSPQPLLSSTSSNTYHTIPETVSPHTPTPFPAPPSTCQLGLQDQISAHPLLSGQPPLDEPVTSRDNSPGEQSSAAFIYPDPALGSAQPLPSSSHPPAPSLPTHGAPTSFAFPSIPPRIQNLPFSNGPPASAHHALHLPNLSHQTHQFPPSSLPHPHPPFQPSSCLAVSSSFQQSVSSASSMPPTTHPQNLPNPSSSYPSVEIGSMPQFNPAAPYRPEMVLHHPSLLPQLDPSLPSSLPSSTPPPALYSTFPSYPLRLCQDPHSSLSIPFRHLYRQHQHGHPQGSYLDMSTRAVY